MDTAIHRVQRVMSVNKALNLKLFALRIAQGEI